MSIVNINASQKYNVIIDHGLLDNVGEYLSQITNPCKVMIISDDNVFPMYGMRVEKSLTKKDFKVDNFIIENGEHSKNIKTYSDILEYLSLKNFSRSDFIIALGGGVVGDLSGFCAATYLRGIKFIQIPTTILAAVDSSIGGKTAINLNSGKNLAGAFYQPSLVICDVDTFVTLEQRQIASGYAEIIKYGMICDRTFFYEIFENKLSVEQIIQKCIEIKRDIVENDERETGMRKLLNFGHTIGHAIEKDSNYSLTHGEAVGIGMIIITKLAEDLKYCDENISDILCECLEKFCLPTKYDIIPEEILSITAVDKKTEGDLITLILPKRIGSCNLEKLKFSDFAKLIKRQKIKAGQSLNGRLKIISSKSELHRLLICACFSDDECIIKYNSKISKDIIATISCLEKLGAKIEIKPGYIHIKKTIAVMDLKNKFIDEKQEIFCDESGSTARFLFPLISIFCKEGTIITGSGKLPQRPFEDLCECLSKHGAKFSSEHLPIKIVENAKPNGTFEISGNISSQYLSGLLFILPFFENCNIKLTTPLESSGYVDMTIQVMKKFGVNIEYRDGLYTANGKYHTKDKDLISGGDWSNAAFFLCGVKEDNEIILENLEIDSSQPDKKIIDILSLIGFELNKIENGISVRRGKNITPIDYDSSETPDIVPILSVLAASINAESVIRNIDRLRFKESDRVKAVCDMILSLGGDIEADEHNIYIHGHGSLKGGIVDSYNDHRIAMSAAVASCICEEDVIILGADSIKKSYPEFYTHFKFLTGGNDEYIW